MLVINSDGMEIEFSGLSADMLGLASFLNIVENRASMPITINRNEYYPIAITHFHLYYDEADNNLLHHNTYSLVFIHQ